ncbi:hypothetical protein BH11ARM2_BH11ARM2_17410 [soil metagenome]
MTILALTAFALAAQAPVQTAKADLAPLSCPFMGEAVNGKAGTSDWMGIRLSYCCSHCEAGVQKDPAKALAMATKKGLTSGVFLFDPISHKRLAVSEAVATTDYEGVRYPFASEAEKATFLKEPKKFSAVPEKEALFCPVSGEAVASYGDAAGFFDYENVRYFTCCAGCNGKMATEPGKYVAKVKDHVKVAIAAKSPAPKSE